MSEPFIIYLDINRICDDDYSECFYSLRDPKTLPDAIDYMGLKDRALTETVLKVFYDKLKEENKKLFSLLSDLNRCLSGGDNEMICSNTIYHNMIRQTLAEIESE